MQKPKIISVLVLFLVLLMAIAIPGSLQLKIILAKRRATENLEKNHLQVLYVSGNIRWTNPGKEIIINDRLFDVKELSQSESGFVLTGMYDNEETALEKQVNDLWEQEPGNGLILLKYFQYLVQSYLPEPFFRLTKISAPEKIYLDETCFYHKEIFIKIPYPPPQSSHNSLFI